MMDSAEATRTAVKHFDIVVVGAGFSGMYMIHRARSKGLSVKCFEAGTGVGGTWYWNRYPGCRVDIESLEYSYSFSDELQQEWEWSERYAAQPELLHYCNHVADRFGLRENIKFDTRVTAAQFEESTQRWIVQTDQGDVVSAQFCVFATGLISEPHRPKFEGLEQYRGEQYLSARWPREPVSFNNKKVGVIGTGASGVQMIPVIAQEAAHLTVFQRTPSFTVPLHNKPMDPEHQRAIKARYSEVRQIQFNSAAGFTTVHSQSQPWSTTSALEVSEDERLRQYEDRWASGGLCFYHAFADVLSNDEANVTLSRFLADKIRSRLHNAEVAEKLVPDYPVLTRRLAADTRFTETFDRDNVSLVDVRRTPIERFSANGVQVDGRLIELDAVIFATGFDVQTGAMNKVDIGGCEGLTLKQHWSGGLRTYLGMMSAGFPNLFWLNGPGSAFFNPPLQAEFQVDWIVARIEHLREAGLCSIEPRASSEEEWVALTNAIGDMTLFPKSNNYYMGDNIPGKPRSVLFYLGGFPTYREQCEAAVQEYSSFVFGGPVRARAMP